MVDWSNWLSWDAGTALLYTIVSLGVYVICKTEDLRHSVKHPFLVGLSVSLLSCFSLGLYAIVPGFTYVMLTYTLDFWVYKLNKKTNNVGKSG